MSVILIVEDEAQVLVLAESYLEENGHKAFSASTVAQALSVIESSEKIDVLFVDIGLGDDLEAGLELARQAVERRPGLKVLYTTGQTITDGMKGLFVEGSAVLPKPYTVEELVTSLLVYFNVNHRPPVSNEQPHGGRP
jgi:DNA-binding response OmpR family regulator